MVFNNTFVLASSSESRKKILKKNNLSFQIQKPKCNEGVEKNKLLKKGASAKKISLELARLKSKNISKKTKNRLVVGSDTVISFRGGILNKARNTKDAKSKIKSISGKKHNIYSSASVFYNKKEIWNTTQKTTVKMRRLSDNEIDSYLLKTGKKILSSVGCYQLEELGPNIIENIKGDFFNVLGFPLFPFLIFLKKHKKEKK